MLSDKMKKFCYEYLKDLHVTNAAIRAGYSKKTAHVIGSENLTKPEIQEELRRLREKLIEKEVVSPEWVINNLKEVLRKSLREEELFDKQGNGLGEFRFDSSGANKSLELIGKTMGMYLDRKDITSKDKEVKAINILIVDENEHKDE